ncbi:MAG: 50S ribosomal protein L16 [Planctomycetota bacterium]
MLMPKRVKYRKSQRGKMKGPATQGRKITFGDYGLVALEHCWLDARQIEAGRVAITHAMGTTGRFWIRVFPHKSVTAKPAETRMGKGKGEPEYYAAVIRPGQILYELGGINEDSAREILNRVAHKMPIRVKMLKRQQLL